MSVPSLPGLSKTIGFWRVAAEEFKYGDRSAKFHLNRCHENNNEYWNLNAGRHTGILQHKPLRNIITMLISYGRTQSRREKHCRCRSHRSDVKTDGHPSRRRRKKHDDNNNTVRDRVPRRNEIVIIFISCRSVRGQEVTTRASVSPLFDDNVLNGGLPRPPPHPFEGYETSPGSVRAFRFDRRLTTDARATSE